jgi:putative glutamine amidotransferase
MRRIPLVGLPSDRKQIGHHPFQAVGEKYVRAVVDAAAAMPLLIPSLTPPLDTAALLASLDGLLLTGSYSNIEPHRYGDAAWADDLHDPARDGTTLGLVPQAIAQGVPVLAICRGLQEVNVALGGSLHPKVHEVDGFDDHRENADDPLGVQYAPSHPVTLAAGGLLAKIAGKSEAMVNSLHGQGLRTLGRGLVVEATAPDGLVEAVRLDDGGPATSPRPFLLAVQWHPEWRVTENPFYLGIFQAFAAACRKRAERRDAVR